MGNWSGLSVNSELPDQLLFHDLLGCAEFSMLSHRSISSSETPVTTFEKIRSETFCATKNAERFSDAPTTATRKPKEGSVHLPSAYPMAPARELSHRDLRHRDARRTACFFSVPRTRFLRLFLVKSKSRVVTASRRARGRDHGGGRVGGGVAE